MQPIRNSSYATDDQEYLSGFIDYLNAPKRNDSDINDDFLEVDNISIVDLSNTDTSTVAERYLSSKNNSEANAMYHVAGYIMGSISRNSNVCETCVNQCVLPVPYDKKYGKYSFLLGRARQKPFVFVTRSIFYFFICMEESINQHFENHLQLTKHQFSSLEKSLKSLPLEIPGCHDLKTKIIKRFLRFKAKSNRTKKSRKRKYDSRSMLN